MARRALVKEEVITFVSSNQGKIREAESILRDNGIKVHFEKVDLPEYQGDPDYICESKCRVAASIIGGPVIVEDSSLCYNAVHGLPGPYVKWFCDKIGSEGLHKLLTGFKDKSASAMCIVAFSEGPEKDVVLFRGETKGTIVAPRGSSGFGWDSCFEPESMKKTYAEIKLEEKNKISHRKKALINLAKFLASQRNKRPRSRKNK